MPEICARLIPASGGPVRPRGARDNSTASPEEPERRDHSAGRKRPPQEHARTAGHSGASLVDVEGRPASAGTRGDGSGKPAWRAAAHGYPASSGYAVGIASPGNGTSHEGQSGGGGEPLERRHGARSRGTDDPKRFILGCEFSPPECNSGEARACCSSRARQARDFRKARVRCSAVGARTGGQICACGAGQGSRHNSRFTGAVTISGFPTTSG